MDDQEIDVEVVAVSEDVSEYMASRLAVVNAIREGVIEHGGEGGQLPTPDG